MSEILAVVKVRGVRALSLLVRMAAWWMSKDIALFLAALFFGAPLTLLVVFTSDLSPADTAMTAATPLVVFYLLSRFVAIWSSNSKREAEELHEHAFVKACLIGVSTSTLVLVVATGSWLVFLAGMTKKIKLREVKRDD